MRVLGVVAVLVATPVLVGVSQDRGQAATSAASAGNCAAADANRSSSAVQNSGQREDKKGRERVGCSPAATTSVAPPASPPPPPPAPAATGSIEGHVYYEMSPMGPTAGLPDWVVELSGGPESAPVKVTVVTDGTGRFQFTGLMEGTYAICQQLAPGWRQRLPDSGPTCTTVTGASSGFSSPVKEGIVSAGFQFRNYIGF